MSTTSYLARRSISGSLLLEDPVSNKLYGAARLLWGGALLAEDLLGAFENT